MTLADILRRHGEEYLARWGSSVPQDHRRLLYLLRSCATGDLGYTFWHCAKCRARHRTPRSCGNRHCPGCGAHKGERWYEAQLALKLDAPYFLLTFTLPETLRTFALSHRAACYAALFRAASRSLEKLARDPRFLGAARLGYTAVLHTWGRQLSYHPHLHVLVPAGGVNQDGEWVSSRPDFLVPVKALSKIFRAKFRSEMQRAKLLADIDPSLWQEPFVTDSRPVGQGEEALRYLSRYVFRVAISNARILSLRRGRVRFRWKKSGSKRWRTMELCALEFIRRFFQHCLPPGFQKVRHYGFCNSQSELSIDTVRRLLSASRGEAEVIDPPCGRSSRATEKSRRREPRCPLCGGPLLLIDITFHREEFQNSG